MTRKTVTIEERKQKAAQVLGMEVDRIGEMALQLSTLRENGVLIDLNIKGIGMFQRTLSWAELGIQADEKDIRFQQFTRGQKYVIPEKHPRRLKSAEVRLRQAFEKYTFAVSGFGHFRWLSYKVHPEFREKFLEISDEIKSIINDIAAEYPQYVSRMRKIYTAVADAAWDSIQGQGYEWIIINGKPYNDRKEIRKVIVDSALALIPSIEKIRTGITVDYVTAVAFGAEEAAKSKANADRIAAQAQAEREKVNHAARLNRIEEEERQAQIRRMHEVEAEHYRQQLHEIQSPYEQIMYEFRDRMSEMAENALESVRKYGFVRGKVSQSIVGMFELNHLMNSHNDRDLTTRLETLRQAMGAVGDERDSKAPKRDASQVAHALEEIMNLAKTEMDGANEAPSMFEFFEEE